MWKYPKVPKDWCFPDILAYVWGGGTGVREYEGWCLVSAGGKSLKPNPVLWLKQGQTLSPRTHSSLMYAVFILSLFSCVLAVSHTHSNTNTHTLPSLCLSLNSVGIFIVSYSDETKDWNTNPNCESYPCPPPTPLWISGGFLQSQDGGRLFFKAAHLKWWVCCRPAPPPFLGWVYNLPSKFRGKKLFFPVF